MRNLNKHQKSLSLCVFAHAILFVLILSSTSNALVLHEDREPPVSWSGRPSSNLLGRWRTNASCVAVSPDCVATTNHQGGGVGTEVVIGGQTYYVARVERYGTSDVRVAKLRLADLSEYASLYTGSSEQNKEIVIGGYGKGRGDELTNELGIAYGYAWASSGNTVLRWGTNKVDDADANVNGFVCLKADFDDSNFFATDYETVIAGYDSGGGWFIDNGSQWQLAGLTYATSHADEAWFLPPDNFFAHRVSEYADWINTTVSKLANCGSMAEDITEDCMVNTDDLMGLASWWVSEPSSSPARARADIDADTAVNMLDFARLASNWNQNYW
ncbi:MAG: hypothetical protein ACIAQZ_16430 [Sedimentisphaeraceae bacterium JB056]